MINHEKEQLASELRGSFLEFTKVFFKLVTGRDFIISTPICRESHHITIARELTRLFRGEIPSERLGICVPPRHGKSVMLSMWTAWAFTHYPDCNFIYISYSHDLAAKHTAFIKQIMTSKHYEYLFDLSIKRDSRAKDHFATTGNGSVAAFGSSGSIVGQDAGLPGLDRFSGAVIIDDPHKLDDVHSDKVRQSVLDNYQTTIRQRSPKGVPIIFIGQRGHEDDLAAFLQSDKDTHKWDWVVLKALDDAKNALYPEVHPKELLHELQDKSPYVFASQFQQDPLPAGGGLFKRDWFVILDEEPEFVCTFITVDTAETEKSWNDATVFSFWGLYEIETLGKKTGVWGLHWLDCMELRIEPKDLEPEFLNFFANCSRHSMPPHLAAIEKKSTGVTLVSVLEKLRGIQIRKIERTIASGSKAHRFIEMQPIIASKRISFPKYGKHNEMCIIHMGKITANGTHRWDDICFARGTRIATTKGYKNIEDLTLKDKVITPFGIGAIKIAGLTKRNAYTVNKLGLIGTPNHSIFARNNFLPLDTIGDADIINPLNFKELLLWRYKKLLCSMESNISSWERGAIILASQKTIRNGKMLKDCMSRFGNFIAEKKFPLAILFIIKTVIILITILKIWSVFRISNIWKNTVNLKKNMGIAKGTKEIYGERSRNQKNGIEARKALHGIGKTLKQAYTNLKNIFAMNAIMLFGRQHQHQQSFAAKNVLADIEGRTPQLSKVIAVDAIKNSHLKSNPAKKEPASTVQNSAPYQDVYNLTVETYGVYYANGILVSNCDTASDAIQLSLIDKTIYNTGNKEKKYNQIAAELNDVVKRRARIS